MQTSRATRAEAVQDLGVQADVEKITDIDAIMEMGVMMTPRWPLTARLSASESSEQGPDRFISQRRKIKWPDAHAAETAKPISSMPAQERQTPGICPTR
jgi:hypothetical protein